ncbi:hypothetical protein R6Q57_011435 [Mikania cordata]
MDADMPHQEDVALQGPSSEPEWLQFEPASTAAMRCRRIIRMSVATPLREEDDEELPPDIEFSLGGQHFEMSIERFAVHLGIYYEPEIVRDDFTQGLT